ncbi:GMC oxidoreductase [Serendipita vermifera MAFF 305830]|uniref:GMC oxidoreductase n=1 Tax=Serendipita vermifera MAFF 305830 TaxID=933852 RepID=A0A0C3AFL8_SERVB|nr:GMC oxidoreductase [Serendipita vermifera MAFF 305830]
MRRTTLVTTFLSFASTFSVVAAIPATNSTLHKRASGVSWNPWDAAYQTYDYIVVGGGLTGITVAARLAENPSTTVLVIEAGADDRWDQRVYDIYAYTQAFSTSLDWQFPTDHGRQMVAGKTLGGGSSINGGHWTRGLDAQYDAWGQLLESSEASLNWNWANLFDYMKKSETWSGPNDQQRAKGADGIDDYHGSWGPVQVTFPDDMFGGPQQGYFAQSMQTLTGIAKSRDLNGGKPNCVAFTPQMMNWHDQDHRSSSPAAYLTPVESDRTNWLTLVNHQVTTLLWANGGTDKTSTGVRFKQADNSGQDYEVYARKEVILAGGAINTPAILQRSGVGDPAHMNPLGISTVISLPTVGKNLQEQTMSALGANSNGFDWGGRGPSGVIAYPNLYQVFGTNGNATAQRIRDNLATWADSQKGSAASKAALQTIFGVQADLIINKNAPVVEIFYDTGYPNAIGVDMWQLLPFSRGTVKITTSDAFTKPEIKVNYFSVDLDLDVQVASAKMVRKLFKTAPLSTLSTGESHPGFSRVPDGTDGGSDANWKGWIWDTFNPVHHPVATCAMMRRDLGGVVNGRLKLYGAANVRIVDASIMPTQISAHLSSTLYAIAEKAADMIKNGV